MSLALYPLAGIKLPSAQHANSSRTKKRIKSSDETQIFLQALATRKGIIIPLTYELTMVRIGVGAMAISSSILQISQIVASIRIVKASVLRLATANNSGKNSINSVGIETGGTDNLDGGNLEVER